MTYNDDVVLEFCYALSVSWYFRPWMTVWKMQIDYELHCHKFFLLDTWFPCNLDVCLRFHDKWYLIKFNDTIVRICDSFCMLLMDSWQFTWCLSRDNSQTEESKRLFIFIQKRLKTTSLVINKKEKSHFRKLPSNLPLEGKSSQI